MEWYVGALAEWTVAYREDWKLYQISRRAWLFLALHVALAITVLVWVI